MTITDEDGGNSFTHLNGQVSWMDGLDSPLRSHRGTTRLIGIHEPFLYEC